jgi:hypothetical protein
MLNDSCNWRVQLNLCNKHVSGCQTLTATHYEIKPSTMQSLPTFLGLTHENPYDFLSEFQTICSTIQLTGFTEDALKMRLFIFSLKDRAKHWFQSLEPDSITSWDQLQQVFLKQYFPIERPMTLRKPSLVSPSIRVNHYMRHGRGLRIYLDHVHTMLSPNGS